MPDRGLAIFKNAIVIQSISFPSLRITLVLGKKLSGNLDIKGITSPSLHVLFTSCHHLSRKVHVIHVSKNNFLMTPFDLFSFTLIFQIEALTKIVVALQVVSHLIVRIYSADIVVIHTVSIGYGMHVFNRHTHGLCQLLLMSRFSLSCIIFLCASLGRPKSMIFKVFIVHFLCYRCIRAVNVMTRALTNTSDRTANH